MKRIHDIDLTDERSLQSRLAQRLKMLKKREWMRKLSNQPNCTEILFLFEITQQEERVEAADDT
jgi:hypothetical protein